MDFDLQLKLVIQIWFWVVLISSTVIYVLIGFEIAKYLVFGIDTNLSSETGRPQIQDYCFLVIFIILSFQLNADIIFRKQRPQLLKRIQQILLAVSFFSLFILALSGEVAGALILLLVVFSTIFSAYYLRRYNKNN